MKKSTAITISKCILKMIGVAGLITIAVMAPNALQILKLFDTDKKRYKPHSIYKAFKRLETQKLVEIKEINDRVVISITEKGKKRLLKYDIDDMEIKRPKKWDQKWRIIAFDVPEKQKNAREALRHKLVDLDFYPLQKSLFVYPFPCQNEIDFIAEIFQIQNCIVFLETNKINNEDKIRKYFKI